MSVSRSFNGSPDTANQWMFSRAGKSTNSLYLVFQEKDKLSTVQSKVAHFMGKSVDLDTSHKEVSPADAIKSLMAPGGVKGGDQEMARRIFEQGWKGQFVKGNTKQTDQERMADVNRRRQAEKQN